MASPQADQATVRRSPSDSSEINEKKFDAEQAIVVAKDAEEDHPETFYTKYRPYVLGALALLILGWWISATVLPATRPRWYLNKTPLARVNPYSPFETGLFRLSLRGFLSCMFADLLKIQPFFDLDCPFTPVSLPSALSPTPWLPDLLKRCGFLLSNALSILLATEFVWQLVGSAFLQSFSDRHSVLNFLKDRSMKTGSFRSPVSSSSRLVCGPHRSIEVKSLGRLEHNILLLFGHSMHKCKADCHCWFILTASHRPVRPEDRRRFLHLQLDCPTCCRLLGTSPCWSCIFLR